MACVFSIIVPIYNVEKYLNKCVESILNQSFDNFELILVDDGSPDNCPKMCDDYAKQDSRVKVVHKRNGGLVSARNAGLLEATSDYVFYVDGDDWLADNALQTFWSKAVFPYSPDMIIYNMVRVFKNSNIKDPIFVNEGFYDEEQLEQTIKPYMMYDKRKSFYHGLLFPSCGGKIVKRNILLEHYCKDEKIRMGEDNAFIFECMFYSKSVFFCDDYFYMYNQLNTGSIRSNYDPNRFENNRRLVDYIDSHLGHKNEYLDFQINAFKAYWLIMAIFHEIKSGIPFFQAASHIKKGIIETRVIDSISLKKLPKNAQCFLYLLKMKLYLLTIFVAKFVNSRRNK